MKMQVQSLPVRLSVGFLLITIVAALLLVLPPCLSASEKDAVLEAEEIVGWDQDGEYNAHYDLETFDKVKGYLIDIFEMTPLEGMSPGIGVTMELKEGDSGMGKPGEVMRVHFGPKPHVRFLPYVAKKGDKLTVRGSWVQFKGEKIFMASKIKINEIFEFKVRRTSDGTPYWTLSKEELVDEKLVD